jgi:hypothetical protein
MRNSLASALICIPIVGCAAPAGTSPSPSTTATSSTASAQTTPESAGATIAPTGPLLPTTGPTGPSWTPRPAEALLLNSAVSVVVDKLNVRNRPSVESKSLGVVARGDFLLIDGYGPFSHDGYLWYPAVFLAKAGEPPSLGVDLRGSDGVRGWIAVGKGSTSYVKQLGPRCPSTIDLASLASMLGAELLACFGSNEIELTGTFGCGGCGGSRFGSWEPPWLAYPTSYPLAVYPVAGGGGAIGVRLPPGRTEPPAGSVIRVRGHFDDPAAATCAISIPDPMHPNDETLVAIPTEAAQLVCAQQFVVENLEVLGTDPGFQTG